MTEVSQWFEEAMGAIATSSYPDGSKGSLNNRLVEIRDAVATTTLAYAEEQAQSEEAWEALKDLRGLLEEEWMWSAVQLTKLGNCIADLEGANVQLTLELAVALGEYEVANRDQKDQGRLLEEAAKRQKMIDKRLRDVFK